MSNAIDQVLDLIGNMTVLELAELKKKYEAKVQVLLAKPEHIWLKGLTPEEAEALRKEYKERYNQ